MGIEQIGRIHAHIRAMNEKLDELELMGYRSGGWDSRTDRIVVVKPGKQESDNVIVGYLDRQFNMEWVYKVFHAVSEAEEAKAFQKATGWRMLWLDEGFFKGERCVVYRDAADLPGHLQEIAKAIEPKDTQPMVYCLPEWGLEGTADELFLKAKSSYKYSAGALPLDALAKIQEILLSEKEQKAELAFYVGILIEIAEEKPEYKIGTYYSLPEVKLDILDSMKIGRCSVYLSPEKDMTLLVELQNQEVLFGLTCVDGGTLGSKAMPVEEFLKMDICAFEQTVCELQAPAMLQDILLDAQGRAADAAAPREKGQGPRDGANEFMEFICEL